MFDLDGMDLRTLIEAVDRSGLTELSIVTAAGEIRISKGGPEPTAPQAGTVAPGEDVAARLTSPGPVPSAGAGPSAAAQGARAADGAAPAAASSGAPTLPTGCVHVRTPLLGVFYRAPEPGAPPFVEVGSRVEPGQTVAIIEAMKVFTSVPAGVRGVVREVLVADREFVEFDQPLLVVELDEDAGEEDAGEPDGGPAEDARHQDDGGQQDAVTGQSAR